MSDQSTLQKVQKIVTTAATWTSVLADVFGATKRFLETLPKPVPKAGV